MKSSGTAETRQADERDGSLGCPCEDFFGRDVFAGSDPDAHFAPAALRPPVHRTFRQFLSDHRRTVILLLGAAAATAFVLAVLPQVTGLGDTLNRRTICKMHQNLAWAVGYNTLAIPIAAGILEPAGFTLSPAIAALSMSGSSIIVAVNAIALKRLRLPDRPA